MANIFRNKKIRFFQALLAGAGLCFVISGSIQANKDIAQYRLQVALKLFPRIAATDQQLDKKLDKEGRICLLVYYISDKEQASRLKEKLAKEIPRIGNRDIDYLYDNRLNEFTAPDRLPTAIFIAEPLTRQELKKVMAYSQKYNRLLFSPFEGDVERGVTAGIYISNKITPYFNKMALEEAGINLHQSLLRVSTNYE